MLGRPTSREGTPSLTWANTITFEWLPVLALRELITLNFSVLIKPMTFYIGILVDGSIIVYPIAH